MDPTEFGDPVKFPALGSLGRIVAEITKKDPDSKIHAKISSKMNGFRVALNEIKKIEHPGIRIYCINLLRKDTLEKIDYYNLPKIVTTHWKNFIVGTIRSEMESSRSSAG